MSEQRPSDSMNPPGCICRYNHKSDPMCPYVAESSNPVSRWRERVDNTVAGRAYFSFSDYYRWCDEFEAQAAEIEQLRHELNEYKAARDRVLNECLAERRAGRYAENERLRAGLQLIAGTGPNRAEIGNPRGYAAMLLGAADEGKV